MNAAQIAVDGFEKFGSYTSIHFAGNQISNEEIRRRVHQFAAVLQEFQIEPGDRIVVMMPNSPEVVQAFQAIWRVGGVIVPIMPQLIAPEVEYIVEHSGARFLLTTPEIAERVFQALVDLPEFERMLVFGACNVSGSEDISQKIETAPESKEICERGEEDLAVLVYTSGTTGRPKGVMLSHGNIISNTESSAALLAWPTGTRTLMVLPLSHVYGILLMNLGERVGAALVLLPTFDPREVLRTIEEYNVERASLVPTMLVHLVRCPATKEFDLSSLKNVVAGSAPLSENLRQEFERVFDCRLTDGYGQSEATCTITAYGDGEDFVVGSAGRAIPGIDVCIMDDDNMPLPVGETGEICTRSASVMQGYWRDAEATSEAIIDGWLHTGDIGHMNDDGYVFITDRKKDLIIKGSENISPREIENAIHGYPAVSEVAVFAVPDATFQEEIAAAIVLKPGQEATADQIREHTLASVNRFKVPRYVTFHEQLPKNSNGKILKRTLRQDFSP